MNQQEKELNILYTPDNVIVYTEYILQPSPISRMTL